MRRIGVLAATLGSATAVAAETMYPVPKGAVEVGHEVFQPGVYEEDHFFLNEHYPGGTAQKHYATVFSGWRSCQDGNYDGWRTVPSPSGPGPQPLYDGWSFPVPSGPAPQHLHVFLHNLIRYWVSPENDAAVTLHLSYASPTDRLSVLVVRVRQSDAKRYFAKIGVTCAKGT